MCNQCSSTTRQAHIDRRMDAERIERVILQKGMRGNPELVLTTIEDHEGSSFGWLRRLLYPSKRDEYFAALVVAREEGLYAI